jgi:hypothetical protein
MADHVARGTAAGQDESPVEEEQSPRGTSETASPLQPGSPAPTPAPKTAAREHESFAASRIVARGARIGGLPKLGWITSGCATLGLAMLRRKGGTAPGIILVAAAACAAWARRTD